MMDWLEFDEAFAITPAFGNLTQAKAQQLESSIQLAVLLGMQV